MPSALREDSGLSLVEVLVTTAIIGLAFIALMSGIWTTIVGSEVHARLARGETLVRSYSEFIESESYSPACSVGYGSSFVIPAEYVGFSATVTAVSAWQGDNPATYGDCSIDKGIQRVSLRVDRLDSTAARSISETRVLYKRCIDDPPGLVCPRP